MIKKTQKIHKKDDFLPFTMRYASLVTEYFYRDGNGQDKEKYGSKVLKEINRKKITKDEKVISILLELLISAPNIT